MAKKCDICGKQKQFGHKVTFSNKKINKSWSPNIRRIRTNINGTSKRINICAKCLKSNPDLRAV
ncbi:MAG: 50S ribosomal protein L28 [Tissierellia bacterium]|nr:50S ribosomal protein L28 [Tissierellia bacterium]